MKYCCEQFKEAVDDKRIVHDSTGWQLNGCCGQCFIITGMVYCFYCGTALPARKRSLNAEKHRVKGQMNLLSKIIEETHQ